MKEDVSTLGSVDLVEVIHIELPHKRTDLLVPEVAR